MRDWTDKDGNKRISAGIVADSVYFGDSKATGNGNSGNNNACASYSSAGEVPPDDFVPRFGDTDGELPF